MIKLFTSQTQSYSARFKKSSFLASILLLANVSFAQTYLTATETENYPDTIKFLKLSAQKMYSLQDYKGEYLDSLTNPKGSILKVSFFNANPGIYFVQKQNDYFLIYKIMADTPNRLKFKRMDFNGKGGDELVIEYERSDGRFNSTDKNNPGGGFTSYEKGFLILDMDSMNIIAHFDHYFSQQNWVGAKKVDGVCNNFTPEITKEELCFTQSALCNANNEDIQLKKSATVKICYTLSESSLLLKRSVTK